MNTNGKKGRGFLRGPFHFRRWVAEASLRATRRAATRIALQTSAVPHHREVVALGAGGAFVALGFRRRALVHFERFRAFGFAFHHRRLLERGRGTR